jgi:hypothetical protein
MIQQHAHVVNTIVVSAHEMCSTCDLLGAHTSPHYATVSDEVLRILVTLADSLDQIYTRVQSESDDDTRHV